MIRIYKLHRSMPSDWSIGKRLNGCWEVVFWRFVVTNEPSSEYTTKDPVFQAGRFRIHTGCIGPFWTVHVKCKHCYNIYFGRLVFEWLTPKREERYAKKVMSDDYLS